MAEAEATNVKVMVRCRPFNNREINLVEGGLDAIQSVILMDGNTVRVLDPEKNYAEREAFEYDHALWSIPASQNQISTNPFVDQQRVFELTGLPAVKAALDGYHCTIFAYGQTGSGKTHTMLGHDEDEGIAPRLVRQLFSDIAELKRKFAHERMEYKIELSFLEIYNEKVKDLLAIASRESGKRSNESDTGYAECRVRFHPEKGTFVEGLKRLVIETQDECLQSIKAGMQHRAVTSTQMNDTSSRSHAIFQICLTQRSPLNGTCRVSIVNLVDLAGSERIKLSGVSGMALQEAKNINLSLTTLRRVIDVLIDNSKLKKGARKAIPPYRESLLTWVLSDSLGGNSKTMMIAAVSPYAGNIEDTLGTLRYGLKAKAIVCNARVNEERTAAVVGQLRQEMEELRRQIEAKESADAAEKARLEEELAVKEREVADMEHESKVLDEKRQQYETELKTKAEEMERAKEQIEALRNIEEEKQRKEEELLQARELQRVAALKLQQQEEERIRKDEELAAINKRKKELEERNAQAAEEEARARVAMEQARLCQFASAFQNAFILKQQRSGLDVLQAEHHDLDTRVAELQAELDAREAQLRQLLADKAAVCRRVAVLEKRADALRVDLTEAQRLRMESEAELAATKKRCHAELHEVECEVARLEEEAEEIEDRRMAEAEEAARMMAQLDDEKERLTAILSEKERNVQGLQESLVNAQSRVAALRDSTAFYDTRLTQLRQENEDKASALANLQQRRDALLKERDDLAQQRQAKEADLAAAQKRLEETSSEAESLRVAHAELRQFVSHRFFPTAQAPRSSLRGSFSASSPVSGAASPLATGGPSFADPTAATTPTAASPLRAPKKVVPKTVAPAKRTHERSALRN